MSRRNLVLLIILLGAIIIVFFGFLYFRQESPTPTDTGGTNFFDQFNPFATTPNKPPATGTPIDNTGSAEPKGEITKEKLRQVSSMPVAGFTLFTKERFKETTPPVLPLSGEDVPHAKGGSGGQKTEFATAIRYVEKAEGLIYQTFVDKIEEKKFSKTIVPKIYEAFFGNKGESVVMRYLKNNDQAIETFVGAMPREYLGTDTNSTAEVKGSFLPENIIDLSVSSDGSKVFYLFNAGDGVIGTTFNFSDKRKTQIFDNAFTEWLSFWPSTKTITLTTKPSGTVLGYLYTLDTDTKRFSKILGGISGLTTLGSPNGKLILYSDSSLASYMYHTDTKNVDVLSVKTLPEKCVWNKTSTFIYCAVPKIIEGGLYPDAWYQGEISFSDQIWRVDVKSGNASMLIDPAIVASGEEIDGIKLALDEGEKYLFFVNKKDSILWELELK